MAIHFGNASAGYQPVASPACAGQVVSNVYELDISGKTLALNDVIDLGPLPAGCTVADAVLVSDDLDTNASPTITFDCGIMSGDVGEDDADRTCGEELFSDSNVGQAGGIARMTNKGGFRITAVGYDRSLGLKVTAAAATEAASGKIALHVLFRAA